METLHGPVNSEGLFTPINPFTDATYIREEAINFHKFREQHPPALCYNSDNQLVKGLNDIEVTGPFVQVYAMTRNGYHVWTTVWPLDGITCTKQEMKDDAIKNKIEYRECYLTVPPTEKAGIKDKGHCGGYLIPGLEEMDIANNEALRGKKVCGVNCGCKTGEDCYGEGALNLVESLCHVSFAPDEDYTVINGKRFTELEAIAIANKIMNHYYTDHD